MPAEEHPGSVSVADPYTTSVQWSRRFIGLKLFLALSEHGESGYIEMIEHQARMGDVLRKLAALYEQQIAWMSEVRDRRQRARLAGVHYKFPDDVDIIGDLDQALDAIAHRRRRA